MVMGRAGGPGVAILVDRLVGEPPVRPHPVAALGSVLSWLERRWYADDPKRGTLHALVGVSGAAAVGAVVGSTTLCTYVAVAGKALDQAAAEVEAALLADDVDRARVLLPALVGRDPRDLDADEIARAVVESLAENTVDAVIAPACWAVVAGAPGASGYRAVNTLDAMVGHRDARYRRFGWASARLDDIANWIPARVAGALVMAVRPHRAPVVWQTMRRDASGHPSPNGGVIEAAFAAALGCRLGGQSRYGERVEQRPTLGRGEPVTAADIAQARRLARDVQVTLGVSLIVAEVALRLARAGGSSRVRIEGRP